MEKEVFFRVKYWETDKMGFVYYANYYIWFEVGRNEYFRDLGLPYVDLEKKGLILPVIKSLCEYKHPANYDNLIKLSTRVTNFTPVRVNFCYNVYREKDGLLLAFGETLHAFVNQEGRPVNLKKTYSELFDTLNNKIRVNESPSNES